MIKVKNIYYMLAYAFSALKEDGWDYLSSEEFDNIHDLIAAILSWGICRQLKRGLYRDYRPEIEVLSGLQGKIEIANTIKQQTLRNRQIVCTFDDFTENNILNQILKTTLLLLIRHSDVNTEHRKRLKQLLLYFGQVKAVDPHGIKWSTLKYHRNNATYKILMSLCFLTFKGLLLTTESGEYKLSKYIDDQHMHSLFERFVLGFYQREFPNLNPGASYIDWNVDDGFTDLLPKMKTDITLRRGEKTLIIDTKYYGHAMQKNTQYDKSTLISANLYQIFTYVKNRDVNNTGKISGVLLYAKTDEEITPDNDYLMSGNLIGVKTLDLSASWVEIKSQLECIAGMLNVE